MSNLNQLGDEPSRTGQEDSIGSAGSLDGKENPFDEQDLPSGKQRSGWAGGGGGRVWGWSSEVYK